MNKKGFAVTGLIYTLMVLFIIIIVVVLSMFNSRKQTLDELKNKVLKNVKEEVKVPKVNYLPSNEEQQYIVRVKGYYEILLTSSNQSTLKATIYLKEGEIFSIKVGSKLFHNGTTVITLGETPFLQLTNEGYYINEQEGKEIINPIYTKNNKTLADGILNITYQETTRNNTDLNKIRYVKDCINGTIFGNVNKWNEIKIIIDGDNKAFEKLSDSGLKSMITDNQRNTSYMSEDTCVEIDLERTYNIDYIISMHEAEKKYFNHRIYVSTTGEKNSYITVYNNELVETENGIYVSAFEKPLTLKIGGVYAPIKYELNSSWLRLFHHNNVSGTVMWDAKAQVIAKDGYDELHQQSILYYIDQFKTNGEYQLLLEYPDVDQNKYNRWTQTSNFTTASSITGFKNIKTDFTSTVAPFNGLKLNGVNAIISGSTSWYYAIGATNKTIQGILGYNENIITGTVDLWINIDQYLKNK